MLHFKEKAKELWQYWCLSIHSKWSLQHHRILRITWFTWHTIVSTTLWVHWKQVCYCKGCSYATFWTSQEFPSEKERGLQWSSTKFNHWLPTFNWGWWRWLCDLKLLFLTHDDIVLRNNIDNICLCTPFLYCTSMRLVHSILYYNGYLQTYI